MNALLLMKPRAFDTVEPDLNASDCMQVLSSPHAALAARSGGLVGGSSFSSARSSYGSAGGSGYSASSRSYGSSG